MHRATDTIHLGLMLAALGITYLVPFELLLLSYVVLGPAHYFTEISWLHDRKYFATSTHFAPAMVTIACVLALSVYPYAVTHRVSDSLHGIVSAVTAKGSP